MKLIKDLGMGYNSTYKRSKKPTRKFRFGLYECPVCFTHFRACTSSVKRGLSKQCKTCYINTKRKDHDHHTKLYKVWGSIKTRCYNPKNKAYKYYGAKGITLCDEWKDDYGAFEKWSNANGYKEGLQINKDEWCEILNIEPKIYSPETCQWITSQRNMEIRFSD